MGQEMGYGGDVYFMTIRTAVSSTSRAFGYLIGEDVRFDAQ